MPENKKQKKGLGKGLGALFMDTSGAEPESELDIIHEIEKIGAPAADGKQVVTLKIIDIEPNKGQPRKHFDPDKLEALSESIREHGVVQPILVTPTNSGTYRIVAGERRWRAAKMAGLKEMPCIIREFEEQKVMELALVENLQREDLNPIEEAEGYQKLMDTFQLTQEEIGQRVGKSRSAVANALRLNNLSQPVKEMVIDGRLSQGHARTLLPVEDPQLQQTLAERILKEGLNVRQVEALVASLGKEKPVKPKKVENPLMRKYYEDVENSLSSRLGTKVKIQEGNKKGKIEIEYYSKEDLERILFELRS
ncbi:ParB/RepB/Spo0J family partition protein [Ructibacterium gallinarum]|uniref:ParB/RepB/Spo0J family partition protein n=1 Tax=Ructibacterium gallinarum TaxID=2779355 RepID=A0A9D5M1Z2_9FIRM|nr:ParB/RepB/Spo0J family partition protein [Ructibacterium gallinarum]MBE5039209.1 ParB/RepB/Spo0J family partition protein [Ructibacterium gallinarum]